MEEVGRDEVSRFPLHWKVFQVMMSHLCYISLFENHMLDCLITCRDMLMIEIYILYRL